MDNKEFYQGLAEYEKKKKRARENRLNKIKAQLIDGLKEVSPDADKYAIVYRQIKQYYNPILKAKMKVHPHQSPVYSFFLFKKSDPSNAYPVMSLFKEDIDQRMKNEDIRREYQIPAAKEYIRECIEYLNTGVEKDRDKFRAVRIALEKEK